MTDQGTGYTVLRIKRKATEPPLSSLVIEDGAGQARKRREIKGRGVFRLAETVPESWKGTGEEGLTLKERIKGLLSGSRDSSRMISPSTSPADPAPISKPLLRLSPQATTEPSAPKSTPSPKATSSALSPGSADPPAAPSSAQPATSVSDHVKKMRYRVVPPPSRRGNFQSIPPKIMTYAEEAAGKPLTFVDAEAIASAGPSRKPSLPSAEEQKDMAPFMAMLDDVLHLDDSGRNSRTSGVTGDIETYVYDLYYKDNRPSASTPLMLGAGDGVHIGALLGYADEDEDDFSDVSDYEDEADEDSNDEDYYRNDYPEDEDADEDMEGFKDAFDDSDDDDYNDRRDDRDDPGLWDYR